MSTNDTPGANPANNDVLAMGCWAEHDDGSMIFVEDVDENDVVVYVIFDLSKDPKQQYRDAMPSKDFKKMYSWDPKKKDSIKWTWHDKTKMPWKRVMKHFPDGHGYASAADQIAAADALKESIREKTAAERVAEKIGARKEEVDRAKVAAWAGEQVTKIKSKLGRALNELRK